MNVSVRTHTNLPTVFKGLRRDKISEAVTELRLKKLPSPADKRQ